MLISKEASEKLAGRIKTERLIFCRGLYLSARWFVVSNSAPEGLNLIVLPEREAAEYCAADLYNLIEGDRVFFLPASRKGTEHSSYKSSVSVQRTTAIEKIITPIEGRSFVVTYPDALKENIPEPEKINSSIVIISEKDNPGYSGIIEKLKEMEFEKVDFVSAPGQYAVRGSIIDVFSYSYNYPYRISFFGDDIEKIHTFDCNTQLSIETCDSAEIVSEAVSGSGETGISSILPKDTVVWLDSSDMYREEEFFVDFESNVRVFLDIPLGVSAEAVEFNISPQPSFNKNFEILAADIKTRLEEGFRVCIFGEKEGQLARMKNILTEEKCPLPEFESGKNIHSGFIDSDDRICCYTDHEIFDRFHRVSIRRSVEKSEQLTINDLNSFNIGDYVVHIDHGIGVFGGLVRMKDSFGRIKEVVKLTYRDGDVVFVSVHALNKISRFRSADGEPPKINKLGSKAWLTLKSSAKSRVKDIAKDLIRIYAKRRSMKGFPFSPDSYLQNELESSFMYEDTPDQEAASRAVKADMEDTCPMDRLICGDVGFGKAEIAIRAAFKATADSKQVAVLVPTTILALQHFETFRQRLKDFPCTIDYVSRLRSAKEISEIQQKLSSGAIDIIIGTHKILGPGFEFKDLGLLIIDEEQKFGVSAKEKLRKLQTGVDTLTLTATPIPRTLQFSLLGARDLSIINTAPPNRIPVQTEIILFDEKEIKSIIDYELSRGGQIFFLHNKVEELPSVEQILHRLRPDMKICVAHGQMESKELETRMLDFIHGEYDMLLCTTIVENGLDIPNANTILINQAQNIGLSDLHQLRGRVGRSNRKAFCYLIVPPLVTVTDDARRRLKAIEEFSDLGSGFNIAMQDLDIRGAGNLLGAEQSGFITEMGYETYQKILAEAMEELGLEGEYVEKGPSRRQFVCDSTVETDRMAMIPEDYLDITAEKIRIYKQLDSMNSDKDIDRLQSQISDRYGKIPEELENLFEVVKIRNAASSIGFEKVIVKNGMLLCFFISNPMSSYYKTDLFASVLQKINENSGTFTLKQVDGKLKTVTKGVESLHEARLLLNKLQ